MQNAGGPTLFEKFRRNTDPRIFALEALVVVYSFAAAAFHSDWPSVFGDPAALARLAIPVSAALFGLLLRNAYSDSERPPHATAVDVLVAFALAFLSQAVLFAFKPALMLPRWAPTQGGFLGLVLLAISRSLFPPGKKDAVSQPDIERTARWILGAYLAASALFGSIGLWLIFTGGPRTRVAGTFLAAGAIYLLYIHRSAAVRRASYWYYGSLLPAALVLLAGSSVYPHWIPLFILIAAELNHRAAANETTGFRRSHF